VPTPAGNKEGLQLLLRPADKTRVQALALVRQDSQAEVLRRLVEQALPGMEKAEDGKLASLHAALNRMGVDVETGVRAMARQRIRYAELFDAAGAPLREFPGDPLDY
jgi:hypothetical protein